MADLNPVTQFKPLYETVKKSDKGSLRLYLH